MPQMMNMQNMYQMMSMKNMNPMMYMQSMCMQCMYNMYQMMAMQGMYMWPMMGMNDIGKMMDEKRQFPIPMLVNLQQTSSNQIQISYDRDVDLMKGMNATNYWVKDTMNASPQGIATLGRNASVNDGNSLTARMVKIEQMNGSAKTFILTFNQAIPSGAAYILIICYVTVKGAPPYSGDNGMAMFIGI